MTQLRKIIGRIGYFLREGSFMPRSYIVLEEKKLIFMIMYKAACSSIMASLCDLSPTENYLRIHHILGGSGKIVHKVDAHKRSDCFRFTFVRNPLERLVSCYESKYHADQAIVSQRAGRQLYFDHYLFGLLRKDEGFAHFARAVARIPNCLADRHFVVQSFLVYDRRGRKLVDFVGHFEQLPDAYTPIQERFDLVPLKRYNATDKGNWMDYYDLDTAQRVIKRYARDLDAFGYRASADQLIAYLQGKEKGGKQP